MKCPLNNTFLQSSNGYDIPIIVHPLNSCYMRTMSSINIVNLSVLTGRIFKQFNFWPVISCHQILLTIRPVYWIYISTIRTGWPNSLSMPTKSGCHCWKFFSLKLSSRSDLRAVICIIKKNLVWCIINHNCAPISRKINRPNSRSFCTGLANFIGSFNIIEKNLRNGRTITYCKSVAIRWKFDHTYHFLIRVFESLYFFNVIKLIAVIKCYDSVCMSYSNETISININRTDTKL